MILTLDRASKLSNLLIAYKRGDLSKYLKILDQCKPFMEDAEFNFFLNLSKQTIFTRKGYF